MKIKRYFAPDIRQAMRMVRDEQGPDAVILSNRRVEGGVEIVAALDFDEQALRDKLDAEATESVEAAMSVPAAQVSAPVLSSAVTDEPPLRATRPAQRAERPEGARPRPRVEPSTSTVGLLARLRGAAPTPARESATQPAAHNVPPVSAASEMPRPPSIPPSRPASDANHSPREEQRAPANTAGANAEVLAVLQQELRRLGKVVDMRLMEAGWQASSRDLNTTRLDLLRGLCDRGFSKQVALSVANRLSALTDSQEAWRQAKELLARQLPVADDQLLEYGGIVALVGPTGVGKTTTIAKLAAKFRLRHGPRQVALVTVDNYRIAAHDHLFTYGRLLDVPVAIASNGDELQRSLQGFLDKKLTLIDTAGMGQHDARLVEQLSMLKDCAIPIKPYLVMSAANQLRGLEAVVRAFGACQPKACILTKMDEAAQPAAALSVLMQHRLPLSFVANGQQVPEDLHVARAEALIHSCFGTRQEDEDAADSYGFEDWIANGAS